MAENLRRWRIAMVVVPLLIALPVAVAVVPPEPLSAPAHYIAPTGNDANPCTLAQPCLTLPRAAALAQPGETVLARGGIYMVTDTQDVTATGLEGAPVWITAYPGETALFTGYDAPLGQYEPVIRVSNSRWVILDRLSVCCSSGRGVSITNSQNVTLSRLVVSEIADRALGGNGDNITIEGNVVDRAVLNNMAREMPGGWSGAIASWTWPDGRASRNWNVVGNRVTRAYGECYIALRLIGFTFRENFANGCYSVAMYVDGSSNGLIASNNLRATLEGFERGDRNAYGVLFAVEASGLQISPSYISVEDNVLGPGFDMGVHWWQDPANGGTWNTYHHLTIVRNRITGTAAYAAEFPRVAVNGDPPCCNVFSDNAISAGAVFEDFSAWTIERNGPPRDPGYPPR